MPRKARSTSGLSRVRREILGGKDVAQADELDQFDQFPRGTPQPQVVAAPAESEGEARERIDGGRIGLQVPNVDRQNSRGLHETRLSEGRSPAAKIIGTA